MDVSLLVDVNIVAADNFAPARNLFCHQGFACGD